MISTLKIIPKKYIIEYKTALHTSPEELYQKMEKLKIHVDYFEFYNSVSSVYSSKIEGERLKNGFCSQK